MTMTPDVTHHVTVAVDGSGRGRLAVDDLDLTPVVHGFHIDSAAGATPLVTLFVARGRHVDLDLHAVVNAVTEAPDAAPDPAVVAGWLARVDARTLQETVLARTDLGSGPTSLTEALLRQLIEWASGGVTVTPPAGEDGEVG